MNYNLPSSDLKNAAKRIAWTLVLVMASNTGAGAQEPNKWGNRTNRIVLQSPHFDEAPAPPWDGLNCPGSPLYLIGFESPLGSDTMATLRVRVKSYPRGNDGRAGSTNLANAAIIFRARVRGETEELLPFNIPWLSATDSLGLAVVRAPIGVYRVAVQSIGFRGGEGVIQLRRSHTDSLRAYMDAQAVC